MDNYNNFLKYRLKYLNLLLSNFKGGNSYGIEINLQIKNKIKGGIYGEGLRDHIEDLWTDDPNELYIADMNNNIKYNFVPQTFKDDEDEDKDVTKLYYTKGGNISAVYKIIDVNDSKEYLLKIYDRDRINDFIDWENRAEYRLSDEYVHMFKLPRIKKIYRLFKSYMPEFISYGEINFDRTGIEEYLEPEAKIDYIIGKIYPTEKNFKSLNESQKELFLYNNIKFFIDIWEKKYIHTDYAPRNIGYNNDKDMDLILIDFDLITLLNVDTDYEIIKNENIKSDNLSYNEDLYDLYIKDKNNNEYFSKFNIDRLVLLFHSLDFKFKNEYINIPSEIYKSMKLNLKNDILSIGEFYTEFNIKNTDFNKIPSYLEFFKVIKYIFTYNSYNIPIGSDKRPFQERAIAETNIFVENFLSINKNPTYVGVGIRGISHINKLFDAISDDSESSYVPSPPRSPIKLTAALLHENELLRLRKSGIFNRPLRIQASSRPEDYNYQLPGTPRIGEERNAFNPSNRSQYLSYQSPIEELHRKIAEFTIPYRRIASNGIAARGTL